jgi:SMP-30/Gluconolactonase/LRE-like region
MPVRLRMRPERYIVRRIIHLRITVPDGEGDIKTTTVEMIAGNGTLSNRRVWADLGNGVPDGICIDAEGAIWYADSRTSVAFEFAKAARCCKRLTLTEAALLACSAPRTGEGFS